MEAREGEEDSVHVCALPSQIGVDKEWCERLNQDAPTHTTIMHETVPHLVPQSLALVATTALQYVSRHALHNQLVIAHTALHSFLQKLFLLHCGTSRSRMQKLNAGSTRSE